MSSFQSLPSGISSPTGTSHSYYRAIAVDHLSASLLWSFAPDTNQSTVEPAAETPAERPIWAVHQGSFRVYGREGMRGRRELFGSRVRRERKRPTEAL